MTPEILLIKDRATHFLNQTILDPVNAQKLAPVPEIAETPPARQQKEEAFTKTVQQIKDFNFTPRETNFLLNNMLNGFARESMGWNQYAIRASLEILPFIGLKKLTSGEMAAAYIEAIVTILPSHTEVTADGGFEALIKAGMILIPHMTTASRKKIDTQAIPVLRQELEKRHPYTNNATYEDLAGKIDNLDNSLKTGLIKPIEIKPIDTTGIANKFRESSKDLFWKHLSPEQSATLDSLVLEAIRDFGMNPLQIIEISGMSVSRIKESVRRLKRSGSIPDRNVHEGSFALKVQGLLGKGPLTQSQMAHALGPGITARMVGIAETRLIEREQDKKGKNQPQEKASLEQDIINLRLQGFSRSQIVDQLDIPFARVKILIKKLIREGKIERQSSGHGLNHPITERGIRNDARVDEMQSSNPGITWKEIAERLNLPIYAVKTSSLRLEVYRQIEQLIAQGKTASQIAQERGIDEAKAKFEIARLQRLRDFQRNITSTPTPAPPARN